MAGLEALLKELRLGQESESPVLEPNVDDRDLKGVGDGVQVREDEDLEHGAVLKATLQAGQGTTSPKPHDLVFLHYTILTASGEAVQSTRAEHGGCGAPQPFVLGTGHARPLRGVELALNSMLLHERCALELKPEYAFKHKDCKMQPPGGLRRDSNVRLDVELVHWLSSEGTASVSSSPGVIKRTLTAGRGWETPRQPFEVTFHVTARTLAPDAAMQSGAQYFTTAAESSDEVHGDVMHGAITCDLDSCALPPGLDAALCEMQRGEVAVVWCPVAAASGGTAVPGPPAAPAGGYVEYSLELLDFSQVRDVAGRGNATKRTLRKGRGEFPIDCPLEDTSVKIHFRVRGAGAADWQFDSRAASGAGALPVEFETGCGSMPECLDAAVRLMLRDEVAQVDSDWATAYAGRDDAPAGLTEGQRVQFEVELVDFEAEPNWADLEADGRLARAGKWKDQGNAVFKAGRYALAKQKYLKGIKCVEQTLNMESEAQAVTGAAIKVACLVNLAACAQREAEYGEAITWATKALGVDEDHAKAHFRRAVARYHLGDYEGAREDLHAAKELDPGAAAEVDRELARMAARAKAAADKQRREMSNFFDRAKE